MKLYIYLWNAEYDKMCRTLSVHELYSDMDTEMTFKKSDYNKWLMFVPVRYNSFLLP